MAKNTRPREPVKMDGMDRQLYRELELKGHSEEDKDLLNVAFDFLGLYSDHIGADGLAKGAALADGDDAAVLDLELKGGAAVSMHGLVALLESVVLLNIVEIVTADDNGALHLGRDDDALEEAASDGDVAGERAFLVDVRTFNCFARGLEAWRSVRGRGAAYRDQSFCSSGHRW